MMRGKKNVRASKRYPKLQLLTSTAFNTKNKNPGCILQLKRLKKLNLIETLENRAEMKGKRVPPGAAQPGASNPAFQSQGGGRPPSARRL